MLFTCLEGGTKLKKVKWWLETGFAKSIHQGEFEVEDNATDEEIEQMAKDEAFNNIDWGYEVEK